MPDIVTLRAAKFWVALAGGVVSAVLAALPDDPPWLVAVSAAVTALVVYLVPNAEVDDDA